VIGIRPHCILAVGAALITVLGYQSIEFETDREPGLMAAQMVAGLGFICGGAIWHQRRLVQGLPSKSLKPTYYYSNIDDE
jgi:uncharacterized membrane protein YhiD involved in acid resistance